MIKYILYAIVFIPIAVNAQFLEFGGGVGGTQYTGDLTNVPQIGNSDIAINAIYRLNFSEVVSFKFALLSGKISGDDTEPRDALGLNRNYSFSHNVLELSGVFEYHFLDYRSGDRYTRFSPYAFMGFGILKINNPVQAYEDYHSLQPVIPMGGGIKYLLSKRLTLTGELGVRKTYTDYLDGISDGDVAVKSNYKFGNPNDKDWYFFSGFSLTYVLYKIPCPFPYVPNKSILNKIKAH